MEWQRIPSVTGGQFTRKQLAFQFLISAPASKTVILESVSVHSEVIAGTFDCCGDGDEVFLPQADQIVRFHVGEKETKKIIDPPTIVRKGEDRRISVAAIPVERGACGYWETEIYVSLAFNTGLTLNSDSTRISASSVKQLEAQPRDAAELLSALRDKNPSVRVRAVGDLSKSNLDRVSLIHNFRVKLKDEDEYVRVAASKAAASLRLSRLSSDIAVRVGASTSDAERNVHIDALGLVGASDQVPLLIELTRSENSYVHANGALRELSSPQASEAVGAALDDVCEGYTSQCISLLITAIMYKSEGAIRLAEDASPSERIEIAHRLKELDLYKAKLNDDAYMTRILTLLRSAQKERLKNVDIKQVLSNVSGTFTCVVFPCTDDVCYEPLGNIEFNTSWLDAQKKCSRFAEAQCKVHRAENAVRLCGYSVYSKNKDDLRLTRYLD